MMIPVLICALLSLANAAAQDAKDKTRFVDRGEYVEDTTTGLLWQKDGKASGKHNFYQAAEYAKGLKLGGITGWRVPTAKELEAIFPATDMPFTNTRYNPKMCCAGGEFEGYWTSDLDTRLDDYAYIYQWYAKGGANNGYASKNFCYVRCVRSAVDAVPDKPVDEAALARIPELIKQLGADEFATRESATEELKKIAARIIPQLQAEFEKTKDPEVRARLKKLLGK